MPVGGISWDHLGQDTTQRPVHPPPRLGDRPPAPPNLLERTAGDDNYLPKHFDPTAWTGKAVVCDFGTIVRTIKVWAAPGDELFIGIINSNPSSVNGDHDEYHPGGGFETFRIPATQKIYIQTLTGAAPSKTVRVHGYGGQFSMPGAE